MINHKHFDLFLFHALRGKKRTERRKRKERRLRTEERGQKEDR